MFYFSMGTKRRAERAALILSMAFCWALPSEAAIRYVSPSGNDANSGTSTGSPKLSLSSALSSSSAGDVIKMMGGTYYYGRQDLNKGGTSSAPITIEPYNSTAVIIDGQYSGSMYEMLFVRAPYLTIKGITVTNVNGKGITIWQTNNVILDGVTVQNSQQGGIAVLGGTGEGKSAPGTLAPVFRASDITIRNCIARWNVRNNSARNWDSGWQMAVNAVEAKNVTVSNCQVYENWGEGIGSHLVDNLQMRQNTVYDNFSVNVYLDHTRNSVVERNFITTNWNSNHYRFGTPATGIGNANEYYEYSYPNRNNKYLNNIVYSGRCAFYYGNFLQGGGLVNDTIANNTFVSNGSSPTVSVDWDNHSNTRFVNNIVYNAGSANLAWHPTGSGITCSNTSWYSPYANWQANGMWGANDISTNPQLSSISGSSVNNFRISNFSPARAAGASGFVSNDYFGSTRSNPVSIGAHENNS